MNNTIEKSSSKIITDKNGRKFIDGQEAVILDLTNPRETGSFNPFEIMKELGLAWDGEDFIKVNPIKAVDEQKKQEGGEVG